MDPPEPGEPIDFGAIAAAIFQGHGRFPHEYIHDLTMKQAMILARKVDPDTPPPGVQRFHSVAELRVHVESQRERQAADPWGVGSGNGYHA